MTRPLPTPLARPGSPYEDGRIRLEEYELQGHDGEAHIRTVVRHPNAVVLLPIMADGQVVLIKNYRLPLNRRLLELPAGCLEPGESTEEGAHRELAEETGYRAESLEWFMSFYPSPGILDERLDVFLAQGLTLGQRHLDPTECIDVVHMPFEQLLGLVDSGKIRDAKTIAAALFYDRRRRAG